MTLTLRKQIVSFTSTRILGYLSFYICSKSIFSMNTSSLFKTKAITSFLTFQRLLNNNVASITKVHREKYTRMYPTIIVLPDGASINVRYYEPRGIIKLPLDLTQLSDEERRIRIEKRKPKRKVKITETIDDNFNAKKYLKFIKK